MDAPPELRDGEKWGSCPWVPCTGAALALLLLRLTLSLPTWRHLHTSALSCCPLTGFPGHQLRWPQHSGIRALSAWMGSSSPLSSNPAPAGRLCSHPVALASCWARDSTAKKGLAHTSKKYTEDLTGSFKPVEVARACDCRTPPPCPAQPRSSDKSLSRLF